MNSGAELKHSRMPLDALNATVRDLYPILLTANLINSIHLLALNAMVTNASLRLKYWNG